MNYIKPFNFLKKLPAKLKLFYRKKSNSAVIVNNKSKSKKNFDILDFSHRFPEKYPYLLESSATGNIDLARYSIAFFKPNIVLKKIKGDTRNFLNEFDEIWKKTKVSQSNYFHDKQTHFPFLGGWFLYFGYELVKEIEPSITLPDSPYQIPTALAARAPSAVIYD